MGLESDHYDASDDSRITDEMRARVLARSFPAAKDVLPLHDSHIQEARDGRDLRNRIERKLPRLSNTQLRAILKIANNPAFVETTEPAKDDDGVESGVHFEGDFGGGSA